MRVRLERQRWETHRIRAAAMGEEHACSTCRECVGVPCHSVGHAASWARQGLVGSFS
jgi:hypothetical protein